MAGILAGRVALVTGGGQGIGQGVARALAEAGASVAIAQRSADRGEAEAKYLQDTYGVKSVFLRTDVTERAQVEAMVAETISRLGGLHVLVNNAGAGNRAQRLETFTDADMDHAFRLNFYSALWAMQAAFPHMKAQQFGRIVNMGSLNGVNAHMYTMPYNTAKEAVRTLARTAAVEWGEYGITANTICPAAASEGALAYLDKHPEMKDSITSTVPVRRLGNALTDMGGAVVYLASDASSFFTGNTLFLDGGAHINGVPWRPELKE